MQSHHTPTLVSAAAIQAAWQAADTQRPPLYLESLNNEAFCGLVSSAGPSESPHIFVCAVTQRCDSFSHLGHLGTCSVLLTIVEKKISDITEVTKRNTAKSYNQPLHVPGWWEERRPEVIARGFWMWGLGQTWPTFAKAT